MTHGKGAMQLACHAKVASISRVRPRGLFYAVVDDDSRWSMFSLRSKRYV
jgi:hypothetical protein